MRADTEPRKDPDRMMTEADVADLLCQSIRTLQKWRVTGYGPCFHKIGRSVRYRRGDVLDWTSERRRAHTSAA